MITRQKTFYMTKIEYDLINNREEQTQYCFQKPNNQKLKHNVGYLQEIISTELVFEIKICQAMDHIHIVD